MCSIADLILCIIYTKHNKYVYNGGSDMPIWPMTEQWPDDKFDALLKPKHIKLNRNLYLEGLVNYGLFIISERRKCAVHKVNNERV